MGFRSPNRLYDLISLLGLTSGLKLCLDAGDSASYTSGQSWLDTSGGGYDFFRGATSGAAADDPTFNGTPGGLSTSEYWSFDGGDFFRYDTTNETWMQNIHKNNAKFTIIAWLYPASFAASVGITGTSSSSTANGFSFRINTSGQLQFIVGNNDGAPANVMVQSSSIAATAAAWNFVGVSLDEAVGAGGINWVVNGSTDTDSSTYTSPATGNAIHTMDIAAIGAGVLPFINGSRIAMLAMWEGVALSAAQMGSIYSGIVTHQKTATGNAGASVSASRSVGAIRSANAGAPSSLSRAIAKITTANADVFAAVASPVARILTLAATALAGSSVSRQASRIITATTTVAATMAKFIEAALSASVNVASTILKSSALAISALAVASGSVTKEAAKTIAAACSGLAALVLNYWLQRPEQQESWTQAAMQDESWVERAKASEGWTEASSPSTNWTEKPKSDEPWS